MTDEESNRTNNVLIEVRREREKQIAKYGGARSDDQHGWSDWYAILIAQLGDCVAFPIDLAYLRRQMLRTAAVAVACVEWCDRRRARDETPAE